MADLDVLAGDLERSLAEISEAIKGERTPSRTTAGRRRTAKASA